MKEYFVTSAYVSGRVLKALPIGKYIKHVVQLTDNSPPIPKARILWAFFDSENNDWRRGLFDGNTGEFLEYYD